MNELFLLSGLALVFVLVEMTITFALAHRWRNYGVVDVVWSAGFAGLALLYLGAGPAGGRNSPPSWPAWILTVMIVLWSLRLAIHLLVRVRSHHPVEDVRYAQLRREWGENTPRRMFGFFLLQGALQVVLSVPFLVVYLDPSREGGPGPLRPAHWAGLALWMVALAGESLADRQLARFRRDPAHRGKVCQTGFWNYSRHPNYFFEWLVWVAFAVFALGSPWGWLGLLSPILMWHFLVNVTGIPLTEQLSVQSKGDAYREYQRTTSAFIPWFKKSRSHP